MKLRLFAALACLILAQHAHADSSLLSHPANTPPDYSNDQTSSTAGSLRDSASGTYSSDNIHVVPGSISVSASGAVPADPANIGFRTSSWGQIVTDVTVHSPSYTGGGYIRLFFHPTGNFNTRAGGTAFIQNSYFVAIQNNGYSASQYGNGGIDGTNPAAIRTFSFDYNFAFDSVFEFPMYLQTGIGGQSREDGGCSGSSNFNLTFAGVQVFDYYDNPVYDYTATSSSGSARGMTITQGQTYSGFALTNSGPHAIGSTVELLDGTASANGALSATFTGGTDAASTQLASDAVELSGMAGDPIVVQMDYVEPSTPRAARASGLFPFSLGWLNPSTGRWTNAVVGNYIGQPRFINRAYNPATDFNVGNYGIDSANKKVWAVVNHNSIFAVAAVPDPYLQLTSFGKMAPGHMVINGKGVPTYSYTIQATDSLLTGFDPSTSGIGMVTAGDDGSFQFEDVNASAFPRRFYRVVLP